MRHVLFPSSRNAEDDSHQNHTVEGEDGDIIDSSGNRDDDGMLVSFSVGSGLFLHPLATVKWFDDETKSKCQREKTNSVAKNA